MQQSRRTLLSICAHPHPYCLCLISIIPSFFSLLYCFLVCNWLASVFYWKDWLVRLSDTSFRRSWWNFSNWKRFSAVRWHIPQCKYWLPYWSRCVLNLQHDTQEEDARRTNINKEAEEKKPWCCRRMISYWPCSFHSVCDYWTRNVLWTHTHDMRK